MRIFYNGCVYNCTDETTIQNMLSTGGVEMATPCVEQINGQEEQEVEVKTVKMRGRKKKQ